MEKAGKRTKTTESRLVQDLLERQTRREMLRRREEVATFCELRLEESNKMRQIRTRTFLQSKKAQIAYCGVEMVANEIWLSRFRKIFSHFKEEGLENLFSSSGAKVNVGKIEDLTSKTLVSVVRHPFSR